MVSSNKEAMIELYRARRKIALKLLGGVCVECGVSENLEIDHIDPTTKEFSISKSWSTLESRFLQELKKCQLLCKKHHIEKTRLENSVDHGQGKSGKRNCLCIPCKTRKAEYMRSYRRKGR